MLDKVDYVMINVSDMEQSLTFYRDLLGLTLKFQSPEWTEFQTGATTLALHRAAPSIDGAASEHRGAPRAGTCSIGFAVDDLQKTYEDLQARGVQFFVPPTRQENAGVRLAVCTDPDGLSITFSGK